MSGCNLGNNRRDAIMYDGLLVRRNHDLVLDGLEVRRTIELVTS